mmetsp:Transcript_71548/g.197556  ORF Transcript_71548/g.197556 Transcript_71548/m.197556 type:complete len:276 (-) Transcript_71548:1160-1987(-)
MSCLSSLMTLMYSVLSRCILCSARWLSSNWRECASCLSWKLLCSLTRRTTVLFNSRCLAISSSKVNASVPRRLSVRTRSSGESQISLESPPLSSLASSPEMLTPRELADLASSSCGACTAKVYFRKSLGVKSRSRSHLLRCWSNSLTTASKLIFSKEVQATLNLSLSMSAQGVPLSMECFLWPPLISLATSFNDETRGLTEGTPPVHEASAWWQNPTRCLTSSSSSTYSRSLSTALSRSCSLGLEMPGAPFGSVASCRFTKAAFQTNRRADMPAK